MSEDNAIVRALNIYPVKSCKGIPLEKANIGPFGFINDRRWMIVVRKTGRFVTQRQIPCLSLITPSLDLVTNTLTLSAPNIDSVSIPIPTPEEEEKESVVPVRVWSSSCYGVDCGDEVATWLTSYVNNSTEDENYGLGLVRLPHNHQRLVHPNFQLDDPDVLNNVSFADGYPFLVISEQSLEALNSRLESKLLMNRFRPNIVVSAQFDPFFEDNWKKITFSSCENITFYGVKKCDRCKVTTVIQETGVVSSVGEPLRTLATFRAGPDKEVFFGVNLLHDWRNKIHEKQTQPQFISVGDRINVLEFHNRQSSN